MRLLVNGNDRSPKVDDLCEKKVEYNRRQGLERAEKGAGQLPKKPDQLSEENVWWICQKIGRE